MFGSKKKSVPEAGRVQPRPSPARTAPAATPTESKSAASPAPPPAAPPAAPPTPTQGRIAAPASRAHIGPTVRVHGELSGSEDLTVDGQVEGRIVLQDHGLTIGEHADVRGGLWAKVVVVLGKVVGNIHGAERIEVRAGGSVVGDLLAPKVVLADGAQFKGRIDMGGDSVPPPPTESHDFAASESTAGWGSEPDSGAQSPWDVGDTGDETPEAPAATDGPAAEQVEAVVGATDEPAKEKAAAPASSGGGKKKKLAEMFGDFDPTNP